jgi:hypothetical protein
MGFGVFVQYFEKGLFHSGYEGEYIIECDWNFPVNPSVGSSMPTELNLEVYSMKEVFLPHFTGHISRGFLSYTSTGGSGCLSALT